MSQTTPHQIEGSSARSLEAGIAHDWLLTGPDPVDPGEPPGLLEVLLPWPVRWLTVGAVTLGAHFWSDSGPGQQIAWGLQLVSVEAVSIASAFWWLLLAVDGALAAAWFIPFLATGTPTRTWWLHVITFLNRQVGHIALFFVWITLSLSVSVCLAVQLGGLAAVLLLTMPILNGLAREDFMLLEPDGKDKTDGSLLWRRRLLIYIATFIGLVGFILAAPAQMFRLLPFVGSVCGGLGLRYHRHRRRQKRVKLELAKARPQEETTAGRLARESVAARENFRRSQERMARGADLWVQSLVPILLVLFVAVSFWQRRQLNAELRILADGPKREALGCVRDPGGPSPTAPLAVFLVADSQIHELGGVPFPGQSELAQLFAGGARRPVALDMLSSVPVLHFASLYEALRAKRADDGGSTAWAYLGDLADLGCRGELDHAVRDLQAFGFTEALAGISLGNHDSSFQGSFHWSPYWDESCATGRLEKDTATAAIEAVLRKNGTTRTPHVVRTERSFWHPFGGSLASVKPLGVIPVQGTPRGVVGIFLDTSDEHAFDWGLPGSVGAVSAGQLQGVRRAVEELRQDKASPEYQRPFYVIFSHIPHSELSSGSAARVRAFVESLDGEAKIGGQPAVLGLIAAHAHAQGEHRHCMGHRWVREMVVGSTTDAPQQAAVLEVGSDGTGQPSLRFTTLQSVFRREAACGDMAVGESAAEPQVSAVECRGIAATLRSAPACGDLLHEPPSAASPRECQDAERPVSFWQQVAALRTFTGPRDSKAIDETQQREAEALLSCVCRDNTCAFEPNPLQEDVYVDAIRKAWAKPARRKELVCLAWAAGAVQLHRGGNMTMAEAIRCAFDAPTLSPERALVATMESETCY